MTAVNTTADVIVVGAGGSGAVVAARLSENPDRTVILLEAGQASSGDRTPAGALLRYAGSLVASIDPRTSWSYGSELLPGRPWALARGRALGGSMAVNAGYFVRARPDDIARWQTQLGWSPGAIVDAYRRSETDRDHPHSPDHGSAGPIQVERPPQDDPVTRSITAAAGDLGLPTTGDVSVQAPSACIGPLPRNVTHGQRWDTGRAYLIPALGRPNLTVVTGAHAMGVEIRRRPAGGVRATGVTAHVGAGIQRFEAAEVVLCAGAIGSAHLLLLSGIGPAADLERLGRTVVADLPVGLATSDHPQVSLRWHTPSSTPRGTAPLTSVIHAGDLELLPLLTGSAELLGHRRPPGATSPLELLVADQAPQARGTLTLDPAAPSGPPVIRSGYLATERDRSTLRAGVRLGVALVEAASGAVEEIGVPDLSDDESLDAWIRAHLGTALHLTGTAPAGPAGSAEAVTDPAGRVLGVTGLRVVDLSILPRVPARGPAATAVMLGELLNDPAAVTSG